MKTLMKALWLLLMVVLVGLIAGLTGGYIRTSAKSPTDRLTLVGPDGVTWAIAAENGQLAIRNGTTNIARFYITPNGGIGFSRPDGMSTHWFAGADFQVSGSYPNGNPALKLWYEMELNGRRHDSKWMFEAEGDRLVLRDCTSNDQNCAYRVLIDTTMSQTWGQPIEFRASDGITVLMRMYDNRIETYVPITSAPPPPP